MPAIVEDDFSDLVGDDEEDTFQGRVASFRVCHSRQTAAFLACLNLCRGSSRTNPKKPSYIHATFRLGSAAPLRTCLSTGGVPLHSLQHRRLSDVPPLLILPDQNHHHHIEKPRRLRRLPLATRNAAALTSTLKPRLKIIPTSLARPILLPREILSDPRLASILLFPDRLFPS
jgi:hypothetical protein